MGCCGEQDLFSIPWRREEGQEECAWGLLQTFFPLRGSVSVHPAFPGQRMQNPMRKAAA